MKIEVPLYVVAWRLCWLLPVYLCGAGYCLALLCGWGVESAKRGWRAIQ